RGGPGHSRARGVARDAGDPSRARAGDSRARRRTSGAHLQPGPRRAPEHARRPRAGAGRHGARAERPVIDAVLLVAFGGPTAPAEIRPFLEIVTRGRRLAHARLEERV